MSLDSRRKKNSSRTLNSENGGKIPRLVFKCPVCFRWEPSNTINIFQKLLFEEVFSVTEKTSLVTEKPLRHRQIPVTPLLSQSTTYWMHKLETDRHRKELPGWHTWQSLAGAWALLPPKDSPLHTQGNSNCIPTQLGARNCLMLQSYFRQRESTPTTSLKQTKEHREAQWSICWLKGHVDGRTVNVMT